MLRKTNSTRPSTVYRQVHLANGVDGPNNCTVFADGSTMMLSPPTAMTFGPDGNLYVSNWGFGLEAGGGQILKVTVPY
jgi:hypothetical protein